jgi:hypothetical protein
MFELPGVVFDRTWTLGVVTFGPPGNAATEVADRMRQADVHKSWAAAHDASADLAKRWAESSTVEVEAEDLERAQERIGEALAVLRFFMREVVKFNVDSHRVGLIGEADRAIREYMVLRGPDRVAPGWTLVDGRVPFRFSDDALALWEADPRVQWLSNQLAEQLADRSLTGRRAITTLNVLDRAFLSTDPVVRVALFAIAVEVLLCDARKNDLETVRTSALRIAARVAYLTCGNGCAIDKAACPYVLGFKSPKHLSATAEEWAAAGTEWRCSAFLRIARPRDMDGFFERPSLFGARNEAVHEGRTSLDSSDIKLMRVYADEAVSAFLAWVALHPTGTVADLDAEIIGGAARLGTESPPTP